MEKYDASSIRVLDGIEHVRKRPAMYIGDTTTRGMHHLVEEVVANSVDEAMAGVCTHIEARIQDDGAVSVTDDGRGIPVDIHQETGKPALEVVLCTLNAGGKFDRESYKMAAGLHGVGVSCVNALSEWMEAEVWRDGQANYQRFERGEPASALEKRGRTDRRGTRIVFKPDREIFGNLQFDYGVIASRLQELAFLNKGLTITLKDERDGKEASFCYKGGISEFIAKLNEGKGTIHPDVIYCERLEGDVLCEYGFQYNSGYSETVLSFANNIRTIEGGTHMSGFRAALTRTLNNYAKTAVGIKDDQIPQGEDYREGLAAIISVKLPEPQFEGQTKAKLGNREIQGIVEQVINDSLSQYCEENPAAAKAIVAKAVEAARARDAARRARDLTRRKSALSGGGLPGKLSDCSSHNVEETEVYFVEGQSAGGTACMGRDRRYQAILPLKGVILNVEKARVDKMLANEEIGNIITALGTGIGADEFDIAKLRYGKLVIMTDADVDGAHIRTLLLTFFFRHMPKLIEQGRLFVAQAPLYKIRRRKMTEYLYDERRLQEALIKLGAEGTVLRVKRKNPDAEMSLEGEKLIETLRQLSLMEAHAQVTKRRGIAFEKFICLRGGEGGKLLPRTRCIHHGSDTKVSEVFFYGAGDYESFARAEAERLHAEQKELTVIDESDFVPDRSKRFRNLLRVQELHFSKEIEATLILLEDSGLDVSRYFPKEGQDDAVEMFIENEGEKVRVDSISELLPTARQLGRKGLDVQRYKGLGEMNADELRETTMLPGQRTLVRITVGDAYKADEYFTTLAGKDVGRRRRFIEQHALEVKNLDV
ncbi:MAG TPA: DNA topoisomerase (ATP-hydrolyzing) subunit B [Candidatus Brocadiia bacterium]|nr:DNA topoisomerase (ATP-hydrolyzing) subunit B [Candidatus Brocadiia bacterium]